MPKSAPLNPKEKKGLWMSDVICRRIRRKGIVSDVLPCLERTVAIPPSHLSPRGERASLEDHVRTLQITSNTMVSGQITLVDDFITKGTTMLAGVSVLQHAFPNCKIVGFALVRTRGLVPDIEKILDPVGVGEINYNGYEAMRSHP